MKGKPAPQLFCVTRDIKGHKGLEVAAQQTSLSRPKCLSTPFSTPKSDTHPYRQFLISNLPANPSDLSSKLCRKKRPRHFAEGGERPPEAAPTSVERPTRFQCRGPPRTPDKGRGRPQPPRQIGWWAGRLACSTSQRRRATSSSASSPPFRGRS